MTLTGRLVVAAGVLALGIGAQAGLHLHLAQAQTGTYPDLSKPLEEFPQEMVAGPGSSSGRLAWRGAERADLETLRQRLPFRADGLVSRLYEPQAGGAMLSLYMVYSRLGEDRKHHPEICIREVTGAPEDLKSRQQLALDAAGERRVQRFRFQTNTSTVTTVYYWHYSFDPVAERQQSFLQALHQRLSIPAPSLTVQVASTAPPALLEDIERSFLPALDAALVATHLPATARIGCDRLPIGLVRE